MFTLISPEMLVVAVMVTLVAGIVKGTVGFAMPMIMISGLGTFLAPEVALAALILPTLVTNGIQALRQGLGAAWHSIVAFRVFLAVGLVFLLGAAQLVRVLPAQVMFLMIGVPVAGFAAWQLLGGMFTLRARSLRIEAGIGAFAGFIGGISGVWGPPTVAYLTALNTPKDEHFRVQGVIYGLGAVALFFAHMQSGVMRAETAPLSAMMIVPALIGMQIGFRIQTRIDQVLFRRATLFVLMFAGLNLIRRGLF